MRFVSLFMALVIISFPACRPADTPESVVRKWQAHIDNNEFGQAKALSSPRTGELLSWMEALLSDMDADSSVTHTKFIDLACKENGDKAVCHYTVEEEGQLFSDSFILVRIEGKWLIDLPEEPIFEEDAGVEDIIETMKQDSLEE